MDSPATGPLVLEIEKRLRDQLSPNRVIVTNDSARHHGHMGDDGSGESHFTVEIESELFSGTTRLARQRMVHQAVGELLHGRIHALAVKARAPGDPA